MQPDRATATWTSRLAHAWRNDLGVLIAGANLVDDPPGLAADMLISARTLQRSLERLVCISRIELDAGSDAVELLATDLLRAGVMRAKREGAAVTGFTPAGDSQLTLMTRATLAERLIADVVHQLSNDVPDSIAVDIELTSADEVRLTFTSGSPVETRSTVDADMAAATCDLVAASIGARVHAGAGADALEVLLPVGAASVA